MTLRQQQGEPGGPGARKSVRSVRSARSVRSVRSARSARSAARLPIVRHDFRISQDHGFCGIPDTNLLVYRRLGRTYVATMPTDVPSACLGDNIRSIAAVYGGASLQPLNSVAKITGPLRVTDISERFVFTYESGSLCIRYGLSVWPLKFRRISAIELSLITWT